MPYKLHKNYKSNNFLVIIFLHHVLYHVIIQIVSSYMMFNSTTPCVKKQRLVKLYV